MKSLVLSEAVNTLDNKGITIYCGSCPGHDPAFVEAAESVGRTVAERGLPLVYGGGRMGLMGRAAHAALDAGGHVIAIIPQFMIERGWNDPDASETIVTEGMHPRKERMAQMSVGAIALPGGIGTFEELTELITWRQLGLYHGNIVILNVSGYYDGLLAQLDRAVAQGFLPADHRALYEVTDDPVRAVALAARTDHSLNLTPKF